jgi:hypothetical protein
MGGILFSSVTMNFELSYHKEWYEEYITKHVPSVCQYTSLNECNTFIISLNASSIDSSYQSLQTFGKIFLYFKFVFELKKTESSNDYADFIISCNTTY